jgi:hypothetical protein
MHAGELRVRSLASSSSGSTLVCERVTDFIGSSCDEHLAAVEHRRAPRRAELALAATDGIRRRVAAVDALDLGARLARASA